MKKQPSKPLGQIIAESVRGEHDAWLLDKTYPKEPSHQKAFGDDDDRQRMLWQIYDSAQAGTRIPEWAANAFLRCIHSGGDVRVHLEQGVRRGSRERTNAPTTEVSIHYSETSKKPHQSWRGGTEL